MELRHLRYFYETANEMNFTRAAEKLNIAQPPLSKQIKDLETELGVSLFVRRPHFLALTPEGEVLKQYAAQILGLADKASETVQQMGHGLNGTIEIACIEGNSLQYIANWIAEFSKIHPAVQYNIWTGGADDIINRIRSGLSDFAVIADVRDSEGLEHYRLYTENWTALIHKDNPLASVQSETVSTKDLLPYDLIIPTRSDRLEEVNNWYKDSEEKPKIRCRYSNFLTAYELSRCSVGISILPGESRELLEGRDDGMVVSKHISNPMPKACIEMLFNKYRMLPNVVYEFITFIRKRSRDSM